MMQTHSIYILLGKFSWRQGIHLPLEQNFNEGDVHLLESNISLPLSTSCPYLLWLPQPPPAAHTKKSVGLGMKVKACRSRKLCECECVSVYSCMSVCMQVEESVFGKLLRQQQLRQWPM